jgi:hypothetical protein
MPRTCRLRVARPAPQMRERMVFVLARHGLEVDLTVRPDAICRDCGPIEAIRQWKPDAARVASHQIGDYDTRTTTTNTTLPCPCPRHPHLPRDSWPRGCPSHPPESALSMLNDFNRRV